MKKIVAITGMAGAGKALTSDVAREMGCAVLVCGDVVREETRRRGLPLTPENLGNVMLRMREEEGPNVVAKRLTQQVAEEDAQVVVVEGVRSLEEIAELRKSFGAVTIVAVHASPATRFDRLRTRGRSDDPIGWQEFEARDLRELKVGLGEVIALADEMIVNEGTIDELADSGRMIFEAILNVCSDCCIY